MADKDTANHGYKKPEYGSTDWHKPLNENFEQLDTAVEVRDVEEEIDNYVPKTGSKFLAIDTGSVFIGDGDSWRQLAETDISNIEKIGPQRNHVGALHAGPYHDSTSGGGRWALHFWAEEGLKIQSAILDVDLNNTTATSMDIELRKYFDDGETELLESFTVLASDLDDGPNRVDFTEFSDNAIPSAGEYVLCRTTEDGTENTDAIPCRRIPDWGNWTDYSNRTEQGIDLLGATHATDADFWKDKFKKYYYYFFDLEIGSETHRVKSPWSHDVDEIYMRPRDPAEEFDDVSPRALWIDTS